MRLWSSRQTLERTGIVAIGYFGSYARGDWGVGSDLDVVAIVYDTKERFERRALNWDLTSLPVPTELLVYTVDEWKNRLNEANHFIQRLNQEVVWTYRHRDVSEIKN